MTTATLTPTGTRRAPQWWRTARWQLRTLAVLMASTWAVVLVVAAVILAVVSRTTAIEMSAVAVSHHAFLWFPFSTAIMVATTYLPVHVASGMTRRSFVVGTLVATTATALLNAVVATLALLAERWAFDRLGWFHGTGNDDGLEVLRGGALAYGGGLALVFTAGMVSGLLVGVSYYRLGGWPGTLALPLALSPILLTGWLGTSADSGWSAWGTSPFDALPTSPLLGLLVLALAAAVFHRLVRRIPITSTKG